MSELTNKEMITFYITAFIVMNVVACLIGVSVCMIEGRPIFSWISIYEYNLVVIEGLIAIGSFSPIAMYNNQNREVK